jgi:hypothetical protein
MENIDPNTGEYTEDCFNLLFRALGDDLKSPPRKKIANIYLFFI